MKRQNEKGAIVVEATLSLTLFIFLIYTILSIVNIAYVQSKVGVALNSAAKEISQYSYLYYKFGVDQLEKDLAEGTQDSRELANNTVDVLGEFMTAFEDADNLVASATNMDATVGDDLETALQSINTAGKDATQLFHEYKDSIGDDPKQFIFGMAKMAGNEIKEEIKVVFTQFLAKAFMNKNLVSYKGDSSDDFLKRHDVVDGLDGLDFNYSSLMAYGSSDMIQLVVTYDVKLLQLLKWDFTFTFRQCAKTTAWGNGVSLIEEVPDPAAPVHTSSVWDEPTMQRGKKIVAAEKASYTYTSPDENSSFNAYDNTGGKNEFVRVVSLDTNADTYQANGKMKAVLKARLTSMTKQVDAMGTNVEVKNTTGEKVTVSSNPDTRTYKIIFVVPDNADMVAVERERTAFISAAASSGYTVSVEVKKGYGSPTPKATPPAAE